VDTSAALPDAFWASRPALPEGVTLERREPIVVRRAGRGGVAVYDSVDLVTPAARLALLVAYQPRLLASHIPKLKARLSELAAQRRDRRIAEGQRLVPEIVPAVITDVAKPSVIEACRRAGVALLDQRGSIVISTGGVFIFVQGKGVVERAWRGRLFAGKASRVVRFLLTKAAFDELVDARSAQVIASACDLSYAYTHNVLSKLERDGFVDRRSSHAGFRLRDPLGLLKAWLASGERTAVVSEGFYAPATTRQALVTAAAKLRSVTGDVPLFSLASALEPEEIHVAGLPHGAYWPGELSPLAEALKLRPTTPHNFLVLRPDPVVWTASGGLLLVDEGRPEPAGELRRVALPQLAADFAALPGRGREQAEFLLGVYAKRLPYHVDET
jgi:hypothetical protein